MNAENLLSAVVYVDLRPSQDRLIAGMQACCKCCASSQKPPRYNMLITCRPTKDRRMWAIKRCYDRKRAAQQSAH